MLRVASCFASARYEVVAAHDDLRLLTSPLRLAHDAAPPPWRAHALDAHTLRIHAADGSGALLYLRDMPTGLAALCETPRCQKCATRSVANTIVMRPCRSDQAEPVIIVSPNLAGRAACASSALMREARRFCGAPSLADSLVALAVGALVLVAASALGAAAGRARRAAVAGLRSLTTSLGEGARDDDDNDEALLALARAERLSQRKSRASERPKRLLSAMREGGVVAELRVHAEGELVSTLHECWLELSSSTSSLLVSTLYDRGETEPLFEIQIITLLSIVFGRNGGGEGGGGLQQLGFDAAKESVAWRELHLSTDLAREYTFFFDSDSAALEWAQGLQALLVDLGSLEGEAQLASLLWLRARMRLQRLAAIERRPPASVLADVIRQSSRLPAGTHATESRRSRFDT